MPSGTRSFNAINGHELKAIILKELTQELSLDPRFKSEAPCPKLTMAFRLRVDAYPMDTGPFTVAVTTGWSDVGVVSAGPARIVAGVKRDLDMDERFNLHLTYPQVTWDWRLNVDLPAAPARIAPAAEPRVTGRKIDFTDPVVDTAMHPANAELLRREARMADASGRHSEAEILRESIPEGFGKTTAEPGIIVDAQGRKYRMVPVAETPAEMQTVASPISPTELRHNRLDKFTESGLEIEAGFRPSPGDALAGSFGDGSPIGAAQTREAVEHVELGRAHPGLEAGGAGTADGIRREGGLPVPSRTATSGGIVDLPAGSF